MPGEELVPISVELPREVVDWIDGINLHLGLRSRGATIARLLQEVRGEALKDEEEAGEA
jgi:metal-responsive CopG/Arc/MetJ family transcriptional regulator